MTNIACLPNDGKQAVRAPYYSTVAPGSNAAAEVCRRMPGHEAGRPSGFIELKRVTDRGMSCRRIELREPIVHKLA